MNQPLEALILARAKKFIANHLLQTLRNATIHSVFSQVKVCNKWLAMNFLALADIKALSG